MDTPKLRIPQWQEALDRAAPHLEKFQNDLDAISDDIRALEKYLTDSGFRIETGTEGLAWMEYGKSWRLCHLEDSSDGWASRPLIETPAATRWRVANHMADLLEEIARVAAAKPDAIMESSSETSGDDIPF